jgi:hypothetical protein
VNVTTAVVLNFQFGFFILFGLAAAYTTEGIDPLVANV